MALKRVRRRDPDSPASSPGPGSDEGSYFELTGGAAEIECTGRKSPPRDTTQPPPAKRRWTGSGPTPTPAPIPAPKHPPYELFWTGAPRAGMKPPPQPAPTPAAAPAPAPYPTPRPTASPSSSPATLPSSDLPSFGEGSHVGPAPPSPPSMANDEDAPVIPPDPDDLPPRLPCRGHGLRATRKIKRGTVIVSERPFIQIRYPINDDAVRAAFNALPDDDKIEFLSFSAVAKEGEELLVFQDIFDTNSLPCTATDERDKLLMGEASDDEAEHRAGMFKTICRTNHSCAPNAEYQWVEGRKDLILYALATIQEGEEITASYLCVLRQETLLPHAERRALIKQRLLFDCRCDVCSLSPEQIKELDAVYTHARERLRRWEQLSSQDYVANNVAETERTIRVLKEKRQFTFLNDAYDALFYTHAVWGREAEARDAARHGLAELRVKLGAEARDWPVASWAEDPKSHEDWDLANREPPSVRAPSLGPLTQHQSGESRTQDDGEWEGSDDEEDSADERSQRAIRKRLQAKELKDRQRQERAARRRGGGRAQH
ncbi:SET domain-containing protein 5 [Vanrija pseudolonga]|uniref:SET domain-containing protein 5 n=1 Tax=Vanrija pseudolonga TaxID=143232 RepID=A0AAF0XZ48_9TREE|nr:SET domain-containing protein 5 [Vanrija pseudolonga]